MNLPPVFWWLLAALSVLLWLAVLAHAVHLLRLHKKNKRQHDD